MGLSVLSQHVLQAGTRARERRGKHMDPSLPAVAGDGGAKQPRLGVPCATDNIILGSLSSIDEHASDAGSASRGADGQAADP